MKITNDNILIITFMIICSIIGIILGWYAYTPEKYPEQKPTTKLRVNEMDTRIGDTIYYNFSNDKDIMTLGTSKDDSEGYLILIP